MWAQDLPRDLVKALGVGIAKYRCRGKTLRASRTLPPRLGRGIPDHPLYQVDGVDWCCGPEKYH